MSNKPSNRPLKFLAGLLFLALAIAWPGAGIQIKAEETDFALVINATVVPLKQFKAVIDEVKKQLTDGGLDLGTEEGRQMLVVAYNSVVDDFIQKALVAQAATAKAITVTDQEIDQRLGVEQEESPAGGPDQPQLATQSGLSQAEVRQSLKEEILKNKLELDLFPRVIVSQNEIRQYYEANTTLFRQSPRWRLSQWKFASPTAAAKGLVALTAGKHPAGIKTQDLGFIEEGQLDQLLERAARDLKPGTLSEVIILPDGWYVLKLVEFVPAQIVPLNQVKDKIKDFLSQVKRQKLFQDWLVGQRKQAKIIIDPKLIPEVEHE